MVTGANGLLGQKVVALLSREDPITLIATGRGPDRNRTSGGSYSYLSCDLTSKAAVEALVERAQPQAVIHAAAMTQVDDCELNREACRLHNVTATQHLLAACKKVQPFFLYISTDFVFDGENGPYTESDTPNPVNYYGESKLEAEQLVQHSGLPWAIARTVLVYGVVHDMSRSNIVLWVKKSLEEKKAIRVVNDQWRTPTLAEDLAAGCSLIVQKKAEGIFHLSGEEIMTPYNIALRTAEFFHLDKNLISSVDASTFTQPARRPPRTGFIIRKAKAELGFRPGTFVDGLNVIRDLLAAGQ